MYQGISTGKNLRYGKKGELKTIANTFLKYCKKENILIKIKYIGSGRLVIRDCKTNKEIR